MSYRECLHTFLSVYRLGSQNKAADFLSLTQPAVSQHLKILEQHLGKTLFTREGRSLKPTVVAHQLALNITDAMDTLNEVITSTKQGNQTLQGDVYVGGLSEFFAKVIIPHLPTLNELDIRIRFEIDYATLLPRLLNDELNIAQFCSHVVHPQLTMEKLYHQECVLVGHSRYKSKINKKQLDKGNVESLSSLPWIAYNETLLFIKEYYHTVFKKEFNGKTKLVISDLWSILESVSSGLGVTVLPLYFCQDYLDRKKVQILYQTKQAPSHYFYLGWKQGALRDPKVKKVYELIKKACHQD